MDAGFGKWGVRRCRKDEGCDAGPAPALDWRLDQIAFAVFQKLTDQFEWRGDGMTGYDRAGLPLERIKIAVETMGFNLNEALLEKVQAIAGWFRQEFKPRAAPPPGPKEYVH